MEISTRMHLGELAELMGSEATVAEAIAMRDALIRDDHQNTAAIAFHVWQRLHDEAITAAALEARVLGRFERLTTEQLATVAGAVDAAVAAAAVPWRINHRGAGLRDEICADLAAALRAATAPLDDLLADLRGELARRRGAGQRQEMPAPQSR